jgi:hypothetical protein
MARSNFDYNIFLIPVDRFIANSIYVAKKKERNHEFFKIAVKLKREDQNLFFFFFRNNLENDHLVFVWGAEKKSSSL